MGWRGTIRAMEAAGRRAEREAERRRKTAAIARLASDAADAVVEWRNHLRDIVSLHVDSTDDMDWNAIKNRSAPIAPTRVDDLEACALANLNEFRPRFFDLLSGGSEKRRAKLSRSVEEARNADDARFQTRQVEFEREHADWLADKELATRLLNGELAAERDVIEEMQSFSEHGLLGKRIAFQISDEFLHAIVHAHNDDVVPNFRRKQLQSGRLSETKMPVGEANELYQDYVCSVALRVAGDLFGLLPRGEIIVTCCAEMLDGSTGYLVQTPILSVRFVRETFRNLNLSGLDPSDAMRNFVHEMDFKRTKGFSSIRPLRPVDEE